MKRLFRSKPRNVTTGPKKKFERFVCLKYSLTSVEYEATFLFSKFELYTAFFGADTTARSRRVVDFKRVFLKIMFSEMACTIAQKLMNGST